MQFLLQYVSGLVDVVAYSKSFRNINLAELSVLVRTIESFTLSRMSPTAISVGAIVPSGRILSMCSPVVRPVAFLTESLIAVIATPW